MSRLQKTVVACGKQKSYTLEVSDLVHMMATIGFFAAAGGVIYASIKVSPEQPDLSALFNAFCSEANFVHPPVCPPNYIQTFLQTCQYAVINGTQILYAQLKNNSTLVDGMPMMRRSDTYLIQSVCTFPLPPTGYPVCIAAHTMNCFATVWNSFLCYYKENEGLSNSITNIDKMASSAFNGVLAAGILAAVIVAAARILKRHRATQPHLQLGGENYYTAMQRK